MKSVLARKLLSFGRRGALAVVCVLCAASVRADLPEGYEALDGIASTEGGKQYIYTDYVPSSCNIKIEAKVTLTKWGTQGIWCSRVGANDRTMTLFCWASGNYFRIDRNSTTSTHANKSAPLMSKTILTADYGARTFAIDGSQVSNLMASGDFTPAARLAFFASHTNGGGWGNYAIMTIHQVKVYNANGDLEREYVPVRCVANAGKTTEYGLYETVEGKYFSTPGTTAFQPVYPAEITWSEDTAADALVLTASGPYTMTAEDATRITSTTHANFVKRGAGTVIGTPIQEFTGNITVEEGVFRLAHRYDCGADSNGWIRVCNGATLEVMGFDGVSNPRAITGKTIYTTGDGYNGMGVISGGCSWNSCADCRFILEGDSYYFATTEFNFVNYIDLAGHKLTGRQATTYTRWGLTSNTITNSASTPATFDFVGGMLRPENLSTFRGTAADGVVKIRSDSAATTIVVPVFGISSAWPVELGPNVSYSARGIVDHSDMSHGLLSGPLTFTGKVKLATDIQSNTNSIVNLKGTLTGSGTVDIGTGWVNYNVTANDYAGTVTVSRSNVLASAELRAGIGVMAGAAYSSALTTFENADLDIRGGIVATVNGPLVFTGDDQCRLTGGNYTGERTKLSLVRKEGDGELLLSAAVAITGRLEVASGKVRFPSRAEYMPVVGKPGLMGSVTNAVAWTFQSPDQGEVPCVYDTVYPHGTDLTSRWNGSSVYGPRTTMVRGYVWNRTGADVTWTFKSSHADCIWFWLDDEAVFTATRAGSFATRTLTSGPHKFAFITTSTKTSAGSQYVKWVNSTVGSLYDSMPVDFTGQANPAAADLSQFTDPGDGSLFTLDDTATEDLTDPFWLASIDTMAFAPAAEFDLGGYDYTLANLEGAPTVSDAGTLTVGESWKLDPETIASESKLAVSGSLAFAEGAALGLTVDYDRLALPIVEKLDAGLKIASVTGALDIANLTLTPELQSLNATLTTADEGKSLVLTVPATKYMRATETGLELGFSVLSGRPYKEVRLDVYRDGRLVAQKFLGDGHALSGEWTFDGSGYYVVKTVRTALVSDDPDETEFVTVQDTFGQLMVSGERICIVSTEPGDGEYATIIAAVEALGNAGGRVYVRPGTYAENNITNGVEIATPVQVIGMTDDPAKVIVTRAAGVPMRIFRLNHADAALRFLTIRDGSEPWNDYLWGNGGNVLVADNGGSIENCVIRNGSTGGAWAAGGGNVALFNGTMRNCVLIGGMNNQDTANMWVNCGGSLLVYQRTGCAPVVENCLITGCVSAKNSGCAPIGLYGDAKLVNCTVVSNGANVAGGVMLSKMNGKAPQIVNCAFYDNTIRSTPAYEAQVVYGIVQTYRNKAENTPTAEEAAACFVNCAAPVTINATCVATETPSFTDAAHGDYTLTASSPLVNAGYNTSTVEGVGQFDLLGSPRFVNRRVDIGCYEYRAPKFAKKGSCILLR